MDIKPVNPPASGIGTEPKIGLMVPTFNAGEDAKRFLDGLQIQSLRPRRAVAIDSSSSDETAEVFREHGFDVRVISSNDFDHGGTRQMGVEALHDVEIIVFATQDIDFVGEQCLAELVSVFAQDPSVSAAYGRQLPHTDADSFASHARLFNYPSQSEVRSLEDASRLGIKAAFISNSFSAYRRDRLIEMGGFPRSSIFGEDFCVAARMLQAGYKIAYQAEAQVRHSHNYSFRQEFSRYFDIGVLHTQQRWILDMLGRPEGEGMRYLRSELSSLRCEGAAAMLKSVIRCGAKFGGYKLGRRYSWLPSAARKRLSMNPPYWNRRKMSPQRGDGVAGGQ